MQIAAFVFRYLEVVGGELTRSGSRARVTWSGALPVRACLVLAATLSAGPLNPVIRTRRAGQKNSHAFAGMPVVCPSHRPYREPRRWARALALPVAAICAGAAWLGVGG